jgi:hypothetical protein
LQFGDDFAHRLVTIGDLLGDHFAKHGVERLRNVVAHVSQRGDRPLPMGYQLLHQ